MATRQKKVKRIKAADDDDLKRKKTFFKRIFPAFKKKATELSILCGNSVGFICYGPDKNDLHVWPEPQDNPYAMAQIVSQFNAMSDYKRKSHACDLDDFSNLKGLSGDDLRIHLDKINSHLAGIKQRKIYIKTRNLKKPKKKQREEDDDHVRVSENATTFSDCKVVASTSEDLLGFGGVFDELGFVVRGSHETVPTLGSCAASNVSWDVGVSDSYLLDPLTLGFPIF